MAIVSEDRDRTLLGHLRILPGVVVDNILCVREFFYKSGAVT